MSYGEVTTIVKEAKHRRSRQFGHRILTRIRRASPALDPGSHAQEGQDGAAAPPFPAPRAPAATAAPATLPPLPPLPPLSPRRGGRGQRVT